MRVTSSRSVLTLVAALLLACGGESLDDITGLATPDPSEGEDFSAEITAAEGGTLASTEATMSLYVPPGALAADTELTLHVSERQGSTRTSVYELGPEGTQFEEPVTITVQYDGDARDRHPVLAWKDGGTWKPLPGSASRDNAVVAKVNHFSQFAVILVDEVATNDEGVGDESTAVYFTWTDASTDLTWQVPSAVHWMGWQEGMDYCSQLELEGGGWHLPTISELRSLIRECPATETGGACGVTDECTEQYACWGDGVDVCNGCEDGGCNWDPALHSDTESQCLPAYWSSSLYAIDLPTPLPPEEDEAWGVMFAGGAITHNWRSAERTPGLASKWKVRCVRPAP